MQYRWAAIAFIIFVPLYKMETNSYQHGAVMLADKGYRLVDYVVQSINVPSSIECAQCCLTDQRCESLNYQSTNLMSKSAVCELNNSTKSQNRDKLVQDPTFSYYDLQRHEIPKTRFGNSEPSQELTVPRNCSELKTKLQITSDGEYQLALQYPFCNNTVDVYCADMNTSTPKEYITLKAGDTNNYSKKNYVSSVKSSIWASAKTNFAKIRIDANSLTVIRNDFQFAETTWFVKQKILVKYASGADCSSLSCATTKKGKFKMDLTGTGLRFHTPIDWRYSGHPNCQGIQPNNHAINSKKQIVSGNCGGYCGDCYARDLMVELEVC